MRILIATSHRNISGGVEKYLQQILPSLAARGHQLALLYEYRFNPTAERVDVELDLPSCGTQESGEAAGLSFVRQWKPDVVYSQGLESAHLQSALLNEYPTVLYAHNYVGTCISGEKCHRFPIRRPCDRQFGPACLALFYPRRCGGLHPGTMWNLYQRATERNAQLQRYAAILVASGHMRREFMRHGVTSDQIHVMALPNLRQVDPLQAAVHASARPAVRADGPANLLFLGRLTKLKGAAELLHAIPLAEKKLGRPLALTIAGDGPERQHLQQLAQRSASQVSFPGWMGSGQIAKLIAGSDLLVVPSLWPEPFGLVGIEAGSSGLPAVAYDVGGISDWLVAGYSGEIAPGNPPTIEGLAEAIARALSDPAHYSMLSRGAREVAARFTLAVHLSKLENILETVWERIPRTPAVTARGEETIHADV